ncbi:hypothetical protein CLHUN_25990 [Ruminiclostridium hungatei]|uniref:Uncharacterized protein n=1 Tax=Ruminiclostridium hungatei TaxID=48256 RepID=A0A1V4SHP6_RUMHU|nr:hypothetical protein CLHUN_25990 [Ruminiclostridium hungatei]
MYMRAPAQKKTEQASAKINSNSHKQNLKQGQPAKKTMSGVRIIE